MHRHQALLRRRRSGRPWLSLIALLLFAVLSASCARNARLASTWRDPAFQDTSLAKLLIVAVGRTPGERRMFEDRFAEDLRGEGVDAAASYRLIGDVRIDSALVDASMHREGCDGILISRVVDRQTIRRYYPLYGGPGYSGHGYFGPPSAYHAGWWSYYSLGPGYIANRASDDEQRVTVETNLYRHDNGQLVWAGISRQWLASSQGPGDETPAVVRELVAELARSGVVRARPLP